MKVTLLDPLSGRERTDAADCGLDLALLKPELERAMERGAALCGRLLSARDPPRDLARDARDGDFCHLPAFRLVTVLRGGSIR